MNKKNNKRLKNSLFSVNHLDSEFSEEMLDYEDEAEREYGPSEIKTKKRQRF